VYRFQMGDCCYVLNRPPDDVFTVVNRFIHDGGLPHYVLRDPAGDHWRVSQLQMSSKPIKPPSK
jgi:hypothetical protein